MYVADDRLDHTTMGPKFTHTRTYQHLFKVLEGSRDVISVRHEKFLCDYVRSHGIVPDAQSARALVRVDFGEKILKKLVLSWIHHYQASATR